ncbi:hypothetical protein R8O61_001746 [Klebsiella oxytoca]|nr:hypothetical protein [Klebsiella oxytoca]
MALAGGMICAEILLQNFYDPNSAGGCGVAPFTSHNPLLKSVENYCSGSDNSTTRDASEDMMIDSQMVIANGHENFVRSVNIQTNFLMIV